MPDTEASFILQNTDTLFGYIIEYRVTTISQRLQKSECGYIPPAYTSDCIHNSHLFQNLQFSARKLEVLTLFLQLSGQHTIYTSFLLDISFPLCYH